MSRVFDQAVAGIKTLPESRQDELGEVLLLLAEAERSDARLSPEQIAKVRRRIANAETAVSEEEADAFFARLP